MKSLKEQEKRDALNEILINLSRSQDILKDSKERSDFFIRLESVYYNNTADNFRHYYSDIFSTLTLIDGDTKLGSLDILAQNIQAIKDGYKSLNKDENNKRIDISKEISKLYDHINLEIGRINYTKTITNETKSDIVKTHSLINQIDNKIKKTDTTVNDKFREFKDTANLLEKEIKSNQKEMQTEYITILGIFASIVVVFTGEINFSSAIFQNINAVSIYRLLSTICLIGIVLFNMTWILLDFIRSINGKANRRSWIFWVINILFILGLIAIFISYKFKLI